MSVLKKMAIPAVCCLALTAGAWLLHAQVSLSDMRIRFPDGTIQTTAAHNCDNANDPDDEMIRVGGICIDKYEASIWSQPDGGIQYGIDTNGDFVVDPGHEYPCDPDGQDCDSIYARSVVDVEPSRFMTWFQAQAALKNSGKRLPSNAEWQMAVQGTPDGFPCNTNSGMDVPADTGTSPNCVSASGALDMVGNLYEWVADWVQSPTACPGWGSFSDDNMCLSGASTTDEGPHALLRGGFWDSSTLAGPFAVIGDFPSDSDPLFGFRGAR